MTYHSVTAAEIWHDDGKLRQLRQLQHLQLSCNYPAPPADRRKTEDALITGGERETSLEELNKLTNPVWNPVTSSSSAQNMNYSILMTRALHGGESAQAWIRRESVNIRRGPWSGYHCWYHHCRPPVACRLECMDTLQVGIKAGGEQMGIIREQMKILLSKTYAGCSCGTDQLTHYEINTFATIFTGRLQRLQTISSFFLFEENIGLKMCLSLTDQSWRVPWWQ